jgi:signal transduction histidine kinase
MAELLHTGRWEGELVRSRKDGTQVAIASRWSLQRDARGTPVAALETNNDITERKRAEQQRERLRQLEGDLAHINRVSMMGELAASLAHEIKQPIAAIATNAGAVLRWLHRRSLPECVPYHQRHGPSGPYRRPKPRPLQPRDDAAGVDRSKRDHPRDCRSVA